MQSRFWRRYVNDLVSKIETVRLRLNGALNAAFET